MSVGLTETKSKLPKGFISLQDSYLSSTMNPRSVNSNPVSLQKPRTQFVEAKKFEYRRSYSQGHSRRLFNSESLLLLICLTASLLILPLILPTLPPPPFMLLLLPIGILALLLILAFRPATSNARDITYSYM